MSTTLVMDFNRSVSRPLPQIGLMENNDEPYLMGWNISPEDLIHIPDHWLSYPEVRSLYHYIMAFSYTILFCVGTFGNGLVIWIFSISKSLRTPSNLFVLNLALCDFSMVLVLPILIYNSVDHKYPGHLQCQLFALGGSISGIGAGATNAAIAYDRYSTIAKPFEGRLTYGKACIIVICIWIWVFPWCYFPMVEKWSRFVPEGFLTSCSFDYLTETEEIKAFTAIMFVICYVIPLSFIIYFYSQIVIHVFNHEKSLREQFMYLLAVVALVHVDRKKYAKKMNVESLRSNHDANAQSAEVRIAKAAITICCLFIIAWTPYAVVAMIGAFGDQSLLTPIVTMLPAVFAKTVACFDPYVYAISHPKYRLELSKRLPCLGITEKPPVPVDTQSTTTSA